jgi:hypothetical protein
MNPLPEPLSKEKRINIRRDFYFSRKEFWRYTCINFNSDSFVLTDKPSSIHNLSADDFFQLGGNS